MARDRESTIDHPLAARKARGMEDRTAFQAGLPVNTGWTGQNTCPIEKFWWDESDLRFLGVLLFAKQTGRVR